ncbi:MAG: TIGR01459 family HAD-type hydrolase [Gemmobacter sp.]|nr:TIGR01459 family HAD-type hydrolase [Gemmobacter sp.]
MTRILTSLSDVSARYEALYCDLWGCLHNGKAPFPAAVAALQAVRATGGVVVLVTNAPRPKPAVMRQLDRLGVPRDCYDEVVSSGDAAQFALMSGAVGQRVWHLGPDKDETFFTEMAQDIPKGAVIERVPLDRAEGIVCTGLFDDLTEAPEDYRGRLMLAREAGLPMLCANPDIAVDFGDRRLWCAGALAQLYEEIGGQTLYFGKPHPPIYDLAARRLGALREGVSSDRILAVGDGPGTDILGAQGEGIDAVFVTGGLAAAAFGPDTANPDKDLLEAWLADQGLGPAFAIGHLR